MKITFAKMNMDSAKVLLLIALTGVMDMVPYGEAASVNQNFGNGFNAQQPGKVSYASTNAPRVTSDRLNIFDTELLRHAASQNSGNFMISPASVKAALSMLLEGAGGSCAEELKKILRLPSDKEQVRQQFNAFIKSLKTHSEGVQLESANHIFLNDNYTPDNNYIKILKSNYYSELIQANFSNPATAIAINRIINTTTHGLIPDVLRVGDISPDTIMILTNVLYFRGLWDSAFNIKNTQAKCFNSEGSCRYVAMMEARGDYNYAFIEELQSQAIDIPYKGGKYSMVILLPNDANGLSTLITELPYFPLPKILEQLDETEVELSMPRFSFDYSQDLIHILQKLGIQEVFNSNADLFGIVARGVKSPQVNSVFHKTHITVNEQGSIAAAVTGAMVVPLMGTTSARMNIDHPFLFFIRDVATGTILFQGRVTQPNEVYVPPPPKPISNPSYQETLSFPQSQQTNSVRQPVANNNYQQTINSNRQPAPLSANSYQQSTNTGYQPVTFTDNNNYQQSSNVQQIQREKDLIRPYTQRAQPERVQPVYSNDRVEQDYSNRGQTIQQEQSNFNAGQRTQSQPISGSRVVLQPVSSGSNYQSLQSGKQQSPASNIPIISLIQYDTSRTSSNPAQIPNYKQQSPIVSVNQASVPVDSYYNTPTHDGNRVRDNKVSNNVFGFQPGPQNNIKTLNSYTIQTPPSRMDVVYQTTLSKDRDAITFTM